MSDLHLGGTGFVAGHVIDVLLKRGHSVVTTVRSQEKVQLIRSAFQEVDQERLAIAIVPDIASNDAFQDLGVHGLEAAIHVASPVCRISPVISFTQTFNHTISSTTTSRTQRKT